MVAMEPTVVVMVPGAMVLVLVIAVVCTVARTGRHQAVGDVPRVTIPCLRVDRPGLASATAVAGVIVLHDTHTAAARCPDAAAATFDKPQSDGCSSLRVDVAPFDLTTVLAHGERTRASGLCRRVWPV